MRRSYRASKVWRTGEGRITPEVASDRLANLKRTVYATYRFRQIEAGLPQKTLADGRVSKVKLVPFYDRTDIVVETVATLKEALTEEGIIAGMVILVLLLHLRSTFATLVTLPLSVALCFVLMRVFGVDSNIMSLAGLAIAIGDVVDMGIIMTENIYRHVATAPRDKPYFETIYEGASEVGGSILTAVSNTLVSFFPVFFLEGQEGKLFRPLAFTKTFAIGASIVLAVTVVPVMCYLLFIPTPWRARTRRCAAGGVGAAAGLAAYFVFEAWQPRPLPGNLGLALAVGVAAALTVSRILQERFLPLEENTVSRGITRFYEPSLRWILANKASFMVLPMAVLALGLTIWLGIGTVLYPLEWAVNLFARDGKPILELSKLTWGGHRVLPGLGREFMPPLDEGSSSTCRLCCRRRACRSPSR